MTAFADTKRQSDIFYLYAARALRGFGDGFAVIILPAYLLAIGLTPQQVGIVASASLLGTAALTLLVGFVAPPLRSQKPVSCRCWSGHRHGACVSDGWE